MRTSQEWITHFRQNATQHRVNWQHAPTLSPAERQAIIPSLRAWQLGETSDGKHLLHAAGKYAKATGDAHYVEAVQLFIYEEQKHGNNLGRYLDALQVPRAKKDWGDSLFRKVRYFNTNMEIWTLAVIVVESTAQIFYQCMKDASNCTLLKQICTDILIDEAYHIDFQTERMAIIFSGKSNVGKALRQVVYPAFFLFVSLLVWAGHRKLFMAGGKDGRSYLRKMKYKYNKTLQRIMQGHSNEMQPAMPGR